MATDRPDPGDVQGLIASIVREYSACLAYLDVGYLNSFRKKATLPNGAITDDKVKSVGLLFPALLKLGEFGKFDNDAESLFFQEALDAAYGILKAIQKYKTHYTDPEKVHAFKNSALEQLAQTKKELDTAQERGEPVDVAEISKLDQSIAEWRDIKPGETARDCKYEIQNIKDLRMSLKELGEMFDISLGRKLG